MLSRPSRKGRILSLLDALNTGIFGQSARTSQIVTMNKLYVSGDEATAVRAAQARDQWPRAPVMQDSELAIPH